MGTTAVLARLTLEGPRQAEPRQPFLRADDVGLLRGDGIFERFIVRHRCPRHLDEHLGRLSRSAHLTEIKVPGPEQWRQAVDCALAAWTGPEEWEMRLVCTRGPEEGGPPTAFVLGQELPERVSRQRREGIAVVSLVRPWSTVGATEAPWLLLGAKTLSYAVNVAAKRYAASVGADDALFVATDGMVLEGPTSSLVAAFGRYLVSPPPAVGILDSISTGRLLSGARQYGWQVERRPLALTELATADGAWFSSSLNFARVHTLDHRPMPVPAAHEELAALALVS